MLFVSIGWTCIEELKQLFPGIRLGNCLTLQFLLCNKLLGFCNWLNICPVTNMYRMTLTFLTSIIAFWWNVISCSSKGQMLFFLSSHVSGSHAISICFICAVCSHSIWLDNIYGSVTMPHWVSPLEIKCFLVDSSAHCLLAIVLQLSFACTSYCLCIFLYFLLWFIGQIMVYDLLYQQKQFLTILLSVTNRFNNTYWDIHFSDVMGHKMIQRRFLILYGFLV